jgi:hypothetical protein
VKTLQLVKRALHRVVLRVVLFAEKIFKVSDFVDLEALVLQPVLYLCGARLLLAKNSLAVGSGLEAHRIPAGVF